MDGVSRPGAQPRQFGPLRGRVDHVPDWAVLALVCGAQFMVVLDVSVVNVALPAIRRDLGLSLSGLQWVVNGYAIAFAGFLLLGGRAADIFGRKRIFQLGLAVFTLSSLLGGVAQTGGMLLAARVAQGVGGAILSPATLTILTTTFPEGPRRARALGAWSALAGAGGAAGALLGGILTDYAGWRWILFINVPIGVIAITASLLILTEVRQVGVSRSLDVPGAILATAGLMTLVYAIVGTDQHAWGSAHTVGMLVAAVVLLAMFLVNEVRFAKAPLMPLSIFKLRAVSSANAVMLLVGAAIFSSWYFLSLYLQNVLHYSPLKAGLAFLPQTVAIIVGAQLSSRLVSRIGVRPLLLTAPVFPAVGLIWLSRLTVHDSYPHLVIPMVLITIGIGLSFTPLAVSATSGVPREQAGLASGLLTTMRQLGGGIGLAALATVALDRTQAVQRAAGRVTTDVVLRAQTAGYSRAFLVGGVIAIAAGVMALAVPKPDRRPPAGRDAAQPAELRDLAVGAGAPALETD